MPGSISGLVGGLHEKVERGFRRRQIGRKAALVADIGVEPGGFERSAQRVKDFRAGTQRLGKILRSGGHDHEFLKIDRIVGMHAAVDDIHHRHRQHACRRAADIAIERQIVGGGGRLGDRKRDTEDRVGAETSLVGRAVEADHRFVDLDLRLGVEAAQRIEDFAIDRFDRAAHALAEITLLVAVTKLDGLVRAGRSSRRHGGTAERAILQDDIDLNGRIAAAVENFAADNIDDGSHTRSRLTSPFGA